MGVKRARAARRTAGNARRAVETAPVPITKPVGPAPRIVGTAIPAAMAPVVEMRIARPVHRIAAGVTSAATRNAITAKTVMSARWIAVCVNPVVMAAVAKVKIVPAVPKTVVCA